MEKNMFKEPTEMEEVIFKASNSSMKVVYIYGKRYDDKSGSIKVKPCRQLKVKNGDIFALMFSKSDKISKNRKVSVTLSSENGLSGLDGTYTLSNNGFIILHANLQTTLVKESGVVILVSISWKNLSKEEIHDKSTHNENDGVDDIYPPQMDISVDPN